MTLPDPAAPRKPRRRWLFAPWLLLGLAVAGWSFYWVKLRDEAVRRIDAAAVALRSAGYQVAWADRRIDGYPFRLNVTFESPRIVEPSGWGLSAPELKAEAYAYALDHWVAVAPQGAQFTRREGGPVQVGARVLRASVVAAGGPFPRLTVEGEGLTFATTPGARPYWLQSADHLQFHLRPGPEDQGALLLRVDGARARLSGLVARIAQGGPVAVFWDSVFSHASSVQGGDWPSAMRAWAAAGGALRVRQATLTAGESILAIKGGDLSAGPDGAVSGALDAELREAPRAFSAMAQEGEMTAEAAAAASLATQGQPGEASAVGTTLIFQNGKTLLGPLEISPAPRLF